MIPSLNYIFHQSYLFLTDIALTSTGRYDIVLPEFLVSQLGLVTALEPITNLLQTIMKRSNATLRTHNVVFVPVGSTSQQWHVDDAFSRASKKKEKDQNVEESCNCDCVCNCGVKYNYFTILIHLNPIDDNCGGTEIWERTSGDLVRQNTLAACLYVCVYVCMLYARE